MKKAVHKIIITTTEVVVDDKLLDVTCSGSVSLQNCIVSM
jgi:hypothetical protein